LKKEAANSFETLLPIYEITCYNIPENSTFTKFVLKLHKYQLRFVENFGAKVEQTNIKGEDMEED